MYTVDQTSLSHLSTTFVFSADYTDIYYSVISTSHHISLAFQVVRGPELYAAHALYTLSHMYSVANHLKPKCSETITLAPRSLNQTWLWLCSGKCYLLCFQFSGPLKPQHSSRQLPDTYDTVCLSGPLLRCGQLIAHGAVTSRHVDTVQAAAVVLKLAHWFWTSQVKVTQQKMYCDIFVFLKSVVRLKSCICADCKRF